MVSTNENKIIVDLKVINMNKYVEDMLYVSVDFSPNDTDMLMVMRRKGDITNIINLLKDEEAIEVYRKLIGA